MMLSRLTRRLVQTIVTSATTKAMANDSARLLRLEREEQVEAVVLGGEDPGRERRRGTAPEPDAGGDAERGRGSGVEPALGCECADELRAPHADGAGHPELRLPLGGEHDEEVHE